MCHIIWVLLSMEGLIDNCYLVELNSNYVVFLLIFLPHFIHFVILINYK